MLDPCSIRVLDPSFRLDRTIRFLGLVLGLVASVGRELVIPFRSESSALGTRRTDGLGVGLEFSSGSPVTSGEKESLSQWPEAQRTAPHITGHPAPRQGHMPQPARRPRRTQTPPIYVCWLVHGCRLTREQKVRIEQNRILSLSLSLTRQSTNFRYSAWSPRARVAASDLGVSRPLVRLLAPRLLALPPSFGSLVPLARRSARSAFVA